jgi:hypothetical protein
VWLALAFVATGIGGVVYLVGQHNIRSGADHPQVELAKNDAARLDAGAQLSEVVPPAAIDMATSPDAFVIVYDSSGRPLAGSATLDGQTPVPPTGVFHSARQSGLDKITWQPRPGVRSAISVVPYRNGYVLSGRSLRIPEQQEDLLLRDVFLAWLFALAACAALLYAALLLFSRKGSTASAGTGRDR